MNGPGVVHDSSMAVMGDIYNKCKTLYENLHVRGVVDFAFATRNKDYFIKSGQTVPINDGAEEICIFNEIIS